MPHPLADRLERLNETIANIHAYFMANVRSVSPVYTDDIELETGEKIQLGFFKGRGNWNLWIRVATELPEEDLSTWWHCQESPSMLRVEFINHIDRLVETTLLTASDDAIKIDQAIERGEAWLARKTGA